MAAQTAKLGPNHPDTLTSRNSLANAYREAGQNDLAIPILERTLAMLTAKLGPEHIRIARNAEASWRTPIVTPASWTGRFRYSSGQWRRSRQDWAPTTPRRSAASTTSRSPTWRPGKLTVRSRYSSATLATKAIKLGVDHPVRS